MVTVQNAIVQEERRASGRKQENPEVAAAMRSAQEHELALEAKRRASVELALREGERAKKSLKTIREEQAKLEKQRMALHRASTLVESMNALKSFDTKDLGHTHRRGGTAEHVRTRMQVMDRIKARGAPLPPEQANDWEWFKRKWDSARIGALHEKRRDSWGATFKDIMRELLREMKNGRMDAVSRWMALESRAYLLMPSLRC